jgi:hypothetical protein
MRTENFDTVQPYALYLRIRPWAAHDFDVQVGRVPPTFGAFARRAYPSDNPLVGYPLAYQYLTSLRADALPVSADELLRKRSLGWLVRYSVGDVAAAPGVPLVTAFKWDTGIQAHAGVGVVSATASVTAGTVSAPRFHDDNNGRQVAGRVELRPIAGLIAGTSLARGPFVSQSAAWAATGDGHTEDLTQSAWGTDVEYSRGYYLLRFESIVSAWQLPLVSTAPQQATLDAPLRAISTSFEGRYKLRPGLYAAARYDRLTFSDVVASNETAPWDAPVSRAEVGLGYSLQRNVLVKVSFQHNARDGGVLPRHANLGAAQVVFWF